MALPKLRDNGIWIPTVPVVLYNAEFTDLVPPGLLGLNIATTLKDRGDLEPHYTGPISLYFQSMGEYDNLNPDEIWAVIDIILDSSREVRTYCNRYAFNMGLAFYLAGHKRYCKPGATFCYYHPVRKNFRWEQLPWDTPTEEERTAEELLQDRLDAFIVERTDITAEMLQEHRESGVDWNISAEEAVELGIADEILDQAKGGSGLDIL